MSEILWCLWEAPFLQDAIVSDVNSVQILSSGVFWAQYESLALACLRAGRGDRAEELFEERDYL